VNDAVWALHTFDRGPSQPIRLAIGGNFNVTGTVGSSHVAIFERGCPCPPRVYCTAGTSFNGCVPSIGALGTPSASGTGSCVVSAQNVEGNKSGLFFYGVSGAGLSDWGATSSHLCVAPPIQRTTILSSGGTPGVCDGARWRSTSTPTSQRIPVRWVSPSTPEPWCGCRLGTAIPAAPRPPL
jgi:hypothetical protein